MNLRKPRILITLSAAAVGVTLLGGTAFADKAPDRDIPSQVTAWAAAWNGTDPHQLGNLFTSDGTYTDEAVVLTSHGRQEISGWKARTDMLIDNVHDTVTGAYRSGDHITIESVYAGHIKGAPKPFAVPMATILVLDGKQIASDKDYYNLNAVLTQSGLPTDWTPGK
ncbi:nuclear transport factor 2 family protein [Streptantibioticus ferralitis]|uniref:Nuclear transport factor 2 family protein n=1 Tax=Streptantibioticus ferralitis TaxID=236510 RepID=A0ABT5Z5A2_9ACTN|nr:nuclear transport factor 2 family protein [Streptantibioticus ferralitis]MDF2258842.1 nuclear transport factor 2 family protein [Streptantibioticus ferralitis]